MSNLTRARDAFAGCRTILSTSMTAGPNPALHDAIAALAPPGVLTGLRMISPGDEACLLPQERPAFAASVVKVRRASGAARLIARELLARLGHPEAPLPKTPDGAPLWPDGIVGSLAHDDCVAVATVARRRDMKALGIDIEPAERLPADVVDLVLTPTEQLSLQHDAFGGRLHFVVKEAVYKAVHPLDRIFLEHHDVEIDFPHQRATVRYGRVVDFRCCIAPRLVALAYLPAQSA